MKPLRKFPLLVLTWLLLAAASHGIDVVWEPKAQDTPQIETLTPTGVFATGDKVTVACNDKSVTVTLGTAVTIADVVHAMANAINATTATENLAGDETRNIGGYEHGEFRDVVASYSGNDLIVTSTKTALGYAPFIFTYSEVTAGTGALGTAVATQAATGVRFWTDTDNWAGGSLPAQGDTAVFITGTDSILYGLDNTTKDIQLDVRNTFKGSIGLPPVNASNNSYPYIEYRDRHIKTPALASSGVQIHTIGERVSDSQYTGTVYVDMGTVVGLTTAIYVNSGTVHVIGGEEVSHLISGGVSNIGSDVNATQTNILNLVVDGGTVTVAPNVRMETGFVGIKMSGGKLKFQAVTGANPDVTLNGGELTTHETTTLDTVVINGGKLITSDDVTSLTINNAGTFETIAGTTITITNTTIRRGATFNSPFVTPTFANKPVLHCKLSEVNWSLPVGVIP